MSILEGPLGSRLGKRDERALLLGGLVLLVAVLLRFGLQPYVGSLLDTREQIESERALLIRELALLEQAHELPITFEKQSAVLLSQAPRLFDGADPTLIAADVQAYLDRLAALARVLIQRVELGRPDTVGSGVTALHFELRGQGDLEGLLAFLRLLDDGPKLAHVTALTIQTGSPGGMLPPGDYEVLNFQAGLSAFTLAPLDDSTRGTGTMDSPRMPRTAVETGGTGHDGSAPAVGNP